VSWNINIEVTSSSSYGCVGVKLPLEAGEDPFRPTHGWQIVIHIAIDPRITTDRAVALQSQVEFATALAKTIVSGIAQGENGKF
jgi:hypothetical protein